MRVGVPRETFPGERRVALVPESVTALEKQGLHVSVEAGAGDDAAFPDAMFLDKGATVVADRAELFQSVDLILQVRGLGANKEAGPADLELMRPEHVLVGCFDPLSAPEPARELAAGDIVPGGTLENLSHVSPWIDWSEGISRVEKLLLADAQTSGGLLIAVPAEKMESLLVSLEMRGVSPACCIGRFLGQGPGRIRV